MIQYDNIDRIEQYMLKILKTIGCNINTLLSTRKPYLYSIFFIFIHLYFLVL